MNYIGQTNFTNFTQRRVRLLRRRGVNASANATLLRTSFESRNLVLGLNLDARLTHELINGWHI